LAEIRKVIINHVYGEKPPVMTMFPNFACGSPIRRNHLCQILFYRLNSFLGADPRNLGVPIDLKDDLCNS